MKRFYIIGLALLASGVTALSAIDLPLHSQLFLQGFIILITAAIFTCKCQK